MERKIRRPVVAGAFYPGDPVILRRQVETYIEQAELPHAFPHPLGIVAPHAGYIYSGSCAGYAYKATLGVSYKRAVIIAPSHRYGGYDFSVGDYDALATPLGEVNVDRELVENLLARSHYGFLAPAHQGEHSLEVQLPFLQVTHPHLPVVPIILGNQEREHSRALARSIVDVLGAELADTLFIASSDLSHYHSASMAMKMDHALADLLERGDADALDRQLQSQKVEACGFGGMMTLMDIVSGSDTAKIEVIKYTHSGETTGETDQVVGYLSAVLSL